MHEKYVNILDKLMAAKQQRGKESEREKEGKSETDWGKVK